MGRAGVPAPLPPVAQLQPHAWVPRNVADVSGLHTVFRHQPELLADPAVAHWRAAWLSGLTTYRLEKRVAGNRQTNGEYELNWLVEQIFLQGVNNPIFHLGRLPLHLPSHSMRWGRTRELG